MKRVLNELIALCIQEYPDWFAGCKTEEDIILCFVCAFAAERGLQTYDENVYMKDLENLTLEDCISSCRNGYSAVINDGQILGYKKAV